MGTVIRNIDPVLSLQSMTFYLLEDGGVTLAATS
jgi:hypothetical protein